MCAIFGPVRRVTAFSKATLPDKTDQPLDPADTPDFSVAALDFESGVVGRITCSIAAPTDHRMRIIGNRGEISADTYRDYHCPVYLDPFDPISLKARNLYAVRRSSLLKVLFGVGGRRVPLAESPAPGAREIRRMNDGPALSPRTWMKRFQRRQRGQQDKCIGLAELADAVASGRAHFPPTNFTLHLTELTLAIQGAGPDGVSQNLTTRFEPQALPDRTLRAAPDYARLRRASGLIRLLRALR
jgi:hypothetical protein